jgi:hypothetical protein
MIEKMLSPFKKIKDKTYNILLKKGNLKLVYDEESKELFLNSTEKITLRLGGNFHLVVDGDYDTSINGEYNLITNNQNIHFDSVNGEIHLNSRLAKQIKNLPESIELRKRIEQLKEKDKSCDCDSDTEMDGFFKDVLDLFERVEKLENKGDNNAGSS